MKKNISDIKMQEVEAMVRQYTEERSDYEQQKHEADRAKKVMDNTAATLLSVLDEFKMTSHKTVYGTIIKNDRFSWTVPKDDESRNAFREYLESKGDFNNLWTVHSQTLNGRAKAWLEEAVEAGDVDWAIPGLTEPSHSQYLSFRAKK